MKRLAMMVIGLAVAIGAGVPAGAVAAPASKVTICHATASARNPYVRISVNANGLNGHGTHPGDIIPAPRSGCPKEISSCDGHGLPCEQIPFMPGMLAGFLALAGGAAFVFRRRIDDR